jgi:hypothetical protein
VDTGAFLKARWREFVDRKDTVCFWSMAIVIAKGLGTCRIVMQTNLQVGLAAIGTVNHFASCEKPV